MVHIERAQEADDDSIRRLAAASGLQVEPDKERGRSQARLLVACDQEGGEPLGFVLGWIVVDELEVLDVCVAQTARRRGLGSALLSHLLREAGDAGVVWAFLEVRRGNRAAQQLYVRHGFSEAGVRSKYYADGEDALLFRCCLQAGN